jgi:hypothetical protein
VLRSHAAKGTRKGGGPSVRVIAVELRGDRRVREVRIYAKEFQMI